MFWHLILDQSFFDVEKLKPFSYIFISKIRISDDSNVIKNCKFLYVYLRVTSTIRIKIKSFCSLNIRESGIAHEIFLNVQSEFQGILKHKPWSMISPVSPTTDVDAKNI